MVRDEETADVVLLPDLTIDVLHIIQIAESILDKKYSKNTEHWQTAMFQALQSHRTNLMKRDRNNPTKVSLHEYLNTKFDRVTNDLKNAEANGCFETNSYSNFIDTSSALIDVFGRYTNTLARCDDFVLGNLTDMIASLKDIEKNVIKCISKLETDIDSKSFEPHETNDRTIIHTEKSIPVGDLFCEDCGIKMNVFNNDVGFSLSLHMQSEEHLKNREKKDRKQIEVPKKISQSKTKVTANYYRDAMIPALHRYLIHIVDARQLVCTLCDCSFSRIHAREHVKGQRHMKLFRKQQTSDDAFTRDEEVSDETNEENSLCVESESFSTSPLKNQFKEMDVPETDVSVANQAKIRAELDRFLPSVQSSLIHIINNDHFYCSLCACYVDGFMNICLHTNDEEHTKLYLANTSELELTNNGRSDETTNNKSSSRILVGLTSFENDVGGSISLREQNQEHSVIVEAKPSDDEDPIAKLDRSSATSISLVNDSGEINVLEQKRKLENENIYHEIIEAVSPAHRSSIVVIDDEQIVCLVCSCILSSESIREHVQSPSHIELYREKKCGLILYRIEKTEFGITDETKINSFPKSYWYCAKIWKPKSNGFNKRISTAREIITRAKIDAVTPAHSPLFEILKSRTLICLLCICSVRLKTLRVHVNSTRHTQLYSMYRDRVMSNGPDENNEQDEDGLVSDEKADGEIDEDKLSSTTDRSSSSKSSKSDSIKIDDPKIESTIVDQPLNYSMKNECIPPGHSGFILLSNRHFFCSLCDCYILDVKEHINGAGHMEKYRRRDITERASSIPITSDRYLCFLCVCKLVTLNNAILHVHCATDVNQIQDFEFDGKEEINEKSSKSAEESDDVLNIMQSKISITNLI